MFGAEVAVTRVMRAGSAEPARRSMCHVVALSREAVRLRSYAELPADAYAEVSLPFGIRRRGRIIWAQGYQAILRFAAPLPVHAIKELMTSYGIGLVENDALLSAAVAGTD